MTKEEIAKLLHLSFKELVKACRNPETLATTISLAIQIGINRGRNETHRQYNQMFRGYNKVSIEN